MNNVANFIKGMLNKTIVRILFFLSFLVLIVFSTNIYSGPPITSVSLDRDAELTPPTGSPSAFAVGSGTCTFTGSGFISLWVFLRSAFTCSNQSVLNGVTISGKVGDNCMFGDGAAFCFNNGLERGYGFTTACCDGFVIEPMEISFPDNCFKDPDIFDPPPPPGDGPLFCSIDREQQCIDALGTFNPVTCKCDFFLTPIILDVLGNGFSLTDASSGVNFDLRPDGMAERISWTASTTDDAFLVLDRNGNRKVDDGTELFGNFTPQPASSDRNGFIALAEFDKLIEGGNGDGFIDERDKIFSSLQLWQDANHNGLSEPNELKAFSISFSKIELDYFLSNRRDRFGNRFRYRTKVFDKRNLSHARFAYDVIFIEQQ